MCIIDYVLQKYEKLTTNKSAKTGSGKGKAKAGGFWRTTKDGSKIYLLGGSILAGGPHGKPIGKVASPVKPSAIDKKIAAAPAPKKKSGIKPHSYKPAEAAKPTAIKVGKEALKKPDIPKAKVTKEKTSPKVKTSTAKSATAKESKVDEEDPYVKYKKEQEAKEAEAMKKASSKGVAKLPPNSKNYKEPPIKPVPPVDEKTSNAIYAKVVGEQPELSPKHKKAAAYYSTDTGYKAINDAYRSGGKVPPGVTSLNDEAKKSKLPPDTVTYRGISKKRAEDIIAMGSMESQGLVSTSTELSTARKFTKDNHVLHIRAKTGVGIKSTSEYPEEQEILQAHGTKYQLMGTFQKELILPPRTLITFIDVEEV